MSLFNKAVIFADTHFGRSGNSPQANQDNLEFLRWAIDEARTWGADDCIMLGDWHDNRHSLGVATMLASLDGIDLLNAAFRRTWWLPGNHDLLYRERRDAASIEFARWLPNIEIVRDPLTIGEVSFLPWLLPNEHKTLELTSRYVFGHLELPGFLRNAKSVMPENDHVPSASQFCAHDWVFTGHFHMRQIKENICYIGNIMPFDFRDDGDGDRGLMLLEWGKDPIFRSWPGQPLYRSIKLTELLDTANTVLKPNMTVRLTVDMPLSYEEADEMRQAMMTSYSLRKIELCHSRTEVDQDIDQDIEFQTVDQIVFDSLEHIESAGLSKERLIDLYQSLI